MLLNLVTSDNQYVTNKRIRKNSRLQLTSDRTQAAAYSHSEELYAKLELICELFNQRNAPLTLWITDDISEIEN